MGTLITFHATFVKNLEKFTRFMVNNYQKGYYTCVSLAIATPYLKLKRHFDPQTQNSNIKHFSPETDEHT